MKCVGKSLTGCLSCIFCDLLCCECNCVIFPAPRPSFTGDVMNVTEGNAVQTILLSFYAVLMGVFRMANRFHMCRCQQQLANSQKNVLSTFTVTQKILVWWGTFSNLWSKKLESPSMPLSIPHTVAILLAFRPSSPIPSKPTLSCSTTIFSKTTATGKIST